MVSFLLAMYALESGSMTLRQTSSRYYFYREDLGGGSGMKQNVYTTKSCALAYSFNVLALGFGKNFLGLIDKDYLKKHKFYLFGMFS